jgi:predicted Zn-dependent protease
MRICALLYAALTAIAQDRPIGSGVNFYSLDREIQLGATLARAELAKSTPTAHGDVRDYVQRLGDRIAAPMPSSPISYKFAVIVEDSPDPHGTHEPPMLPGGFIIVSEYLIRAAHDEAEFAGMLAHAMAHAVARHVTRMLTRREIAQGNAYAGPDAWGELLRTQTLNGMLQFAREFEQEADVVATRATATVGLNPSSFADYIGRSQVDADHPSRSAMPSRRQRVELIEGTVRALPVRPYSSSEEFLSIQRELH